MADNWLRPSRTGAGRRYLRQRELESETWQTRLLAALVAAPVFELSLLIGVLTLTGGRPYVAIVLLRELPLGLHLALSGVAVVAGAIWGMSGITGLLGHLFWTHPPPQRQRRLTALAWAGVLTLPLAAAWLARH